MNIIHITMRVRGRDSIVAVRQLREVIPSDLTQWHRRGLFEIVEVIQADRRGTFDAVDQLNSTDVAEIECVAFEQLNAAVAVQ